MALDRKLEEQIHERHFRNDWVAAISNYKLLKKYESGTVSAFMTGLSDRDVERIRTQLNAYDQTELAKASKMKEADRNKFISEKYEESQKGIGAKISEGLSSMFGRKSDAKKDDKKSDAKKDDKKADAKKTDVVATRPTTAPATTITTVTTADRIIGFFFKDHVKKKQKQMRDDIKARCTGMRPSTAASAKLGS